ncbi:MAG: diguanylate cyclase [Anaerolineae bacterium]|nr:MAG: diguanylate cyclase [Anaerolineae bacterium]
MAPFDDDFYRKLVDNLFDGVYFVDTQRCITYWNHGAERISGFSAEQVTGRYCQDNLLRHVDENGRLLCNDDCPLVHAIETKKPYQAQVYMHHADGHRIPILVRTSPIQSETGEVIGAVEVFSDNSMLVRRLHTLQTQALTDPLTGAGNRRYSEMRLKSILHEFQQHDVSCGLLFIDLDHFKRVNDTWGHETGDQVLRMVANTLKHNVRGSDFVGRWGGEEFIVILLDVDKGQLQSIAEKLRTLIAHSALRVPRGMIRVTTSIGATLLRTSDTLESIIQRADALMYQSKQGGRNRVTIG